jgi:uncharacterized protein YndB with AHSA1/START domain
MQMKTETHSVVCVTHRFSASAERVFDAWVEPETAGMWLFATATRPMASVRIDARVGSSFCFVDRQYCRNVEYAGEYLVIARPRRLVFSLSADVRRICRLKPRHARINVNPS